MRVLLVEDTKDVGEGVQARLLKLGHLVDWETGAEAAEARLELQSYDLVVLDVMLPGGTDGLTLLRRLRARKSGTPVLMLTARSQVDDRVTALDLGADDYLTKPFDLRELEARVRALLRRGTGNATNQIGFGDLALDLETHGVTLAGEAVELTRREQMILELLVGRSGRIVPKEQMVDRLFGLDDTASLNAVEQHMARLRRKLAASNTEIRTLRGLGYKIVLR
ncbi:response regulator transcription factor [Roseomonas haemaphysalidis]|jgi:two-component system response regulator TctD|uniref:Response regulator transcription factor n=1 Tax=Roseomonas haemaphysalidis TaxID=2768162 RepID=A0ABS3KSC2_9PROT|nr:response regulator transcription factor [Roseomonas haemaphysalidis]MBO1080369.1 response regulator transcription factor [Roseomonas haemaphysalidis]